MTFLILRTNFKKLRIVLGPGEQSVTKDDPLTVLRDFGFALPESAFRVCLTSVTDTVP